MIGWPAVDPATMDPHDTYLRYDGLPYGAAPWSELIAERNLLARYRPTTNACGPTPPETSPNLREQEERVARTIGPAH
jgi:hypothetical protein